MNVGEICSRRPVVASARAPLSQVAQAAQCAREVCDGSRVVSVFAGELPRAMPHTNSLAMSPHGCSENHGFDDCDSPTRVTRLRARKSESVTRREFSSRCRARSSTETQSKRKGRRMKRSMVGILALLIANVAAAEGSFWDARISSIRIDSNGWGMVYFDVNAWGTRPTCMTSEHARAFAFNTNTPGGRAILAVAEAAKALDARMNVFGTGRCDIYSNWIEDWSYGVQY